MNKHLFRIIVDRVTRRKIVVSEIAGFLSKGHKSNEVGAALIVSLLGGLAPQLANAQVVPSAGFTQFSPTILKTPEGAPLINIRTPNASGLSINAYDRFSTDSLGATFNNSRASNPWLSQGTAKLIVNQVVTNTPSVIRGNLSIGGDAADLIIANPSGLTIHGASFSNTKGVTLSTGNLFTSKIDQSYEGQGVQSGLIQIGRSGLSTSNPVPIRLLGRSIQIDGPINAGQIEAIAGSNFVTSNASDFQYMDGCGCSYTYGVYATSYSALNGEKITLVSSDKSKPMRLDGNLTASRQIQISADGAVSISKNVTSPVVSVSSLSSDVNFGGTAKIDNLLVVNARNDAVLKGVFGTYDLNSALSIFASAGRDAILTGVAGAYSSMDFLDEMVVRSGRDIKVSSNAAFRSEGVLQLNAGEDIEITTAAIGSKLESTNLSARGNVSFNDSFVYGQKGVTIAASSESLDVPSVKIVGTLIQSDAGDLNIASGQNLLVTDNGAVGIKMAGLSNGLKGKNILIAAAGAATLEKTQAKEQFVSAAENLSIVGKTVSISEGSLTAGKDLTLMSLSGDTTLNGFAQEKSLSPSPAHLTISAAGSVEIMSSAKVQANAVNVSAGSSLFIGANGDLSIDSGSVLAPAGIGRTAESALNVHSTLSAGGDITLASNSGTTRLWGTQVNSTNGLVSVFGKDIRVAEYETIKTTATDTQTSRTSEFSTASISGKGIKLHALGSVGLSQDVKLAATAQDLIVICEAGCSGQADWSEDERTYAYYVNTSTRNATTGAVTNSESLIREKRRELSAVGDIHLYGLSRVRNASLQAGKNIGISAAWIDADGRSTITALNGNVRLQSASYIFLEGQYSYSLTAVPKQAADVIKAKNVELTGARVVVKGASINASQSLKLNAVAGSIDIQPFMPGDYTKGWDYGGFADTPLLKGGAVVLNANGDIRMSAAKIEGLGVDILAAGNLNIEGRTLWRPTTSGSFSGYEGVVEKSVIKATGALKLAATQGTLVADAFDWTGTNVSISAGSNITLNSRSNYSLLAGTTTRVDRNWFSSTTYTTYNHNESTRVVPSTVSGSSITLLAGDNLRTNSTLLNSTGNISITAGQNIAYYALANQTNSSSSTTKNKSFLGFLDYSFSNNSTQTLSTVGVPTQLQSQASITSTSGGDQIYQGTKVTYSGTFTAQAGVGEKARQDAKIYLTGIVNTTQTAANQESSYVVWQKNQGVGSYEETLAITQFNGPTKPTFQAPGGLVVQVPSGSLTTQVNQLSQMAGQTYVSNLIQRSDVDWNKVSLAHESWQYKQAGLTAEGAALVSLAVAVATGGAGASALSTTGVLSSAAANAAFTSLATTASLSLINNQGNLGKTLNDLGSSSTVKALVSAVLTAGIMEGLAVHPELGALKGSPAFSDKLVFNVIEKSGVALTNAAVYGTDLRAAIDSALLLAVVDSVQAQAANQVKGLSEQYVLHKVAHALTGCAAGAALSNSCKSGAIGAAVAEMVAELLPPVNGIAYSDIEKKQVVDRVKLISGGVAAFVGADINEATRSAQVAVENNAFFVPVILAALKAIDSAYTVYQVSQDLADLRDGKTTLNDLAAQKGVDYVTGVIIGSVGKYGLKVTTKAGKSVVEKLSDVASPQALRQVKHSEVLELFDRSKPRNGVQLNDNMSMLVAQDVSSKNVQGVRVFDASTIYAIGAGDAALEKDVFEYGKKLSGGVEFVESAVKPGTWTAKVDGNTAVTIRKNSTSTLADGTKPRWTIDYKAPDVESVNTKDKVEMKFK